MSEPAFIKLYRTGELERRVIELEKLLERCVVCPKDCGNNRLEDEIAACYSGRLPIVSSYTAHFGEEPCLSGTAARAIYFSATAICVAFIVRITKSLKRGKRKRKTKRRTNDWRK
jgi:putative pyruvate formate lyase activating enzyme